MLHKYWQGHGLPSITVHSEKWQQQWTSKTGNQGKEVIVNLEKFKIISYFFQNFPLWQTLCAQNGRGRRKIYLILGTKWHFLLGKKEDLAIANGQTKNDMVMMAKQASSSYCRKTTFSRRYFSLRYCFKWVGICLSLCVASSTIQKIDWKRHLVIIGFWAADLAVKHQLLFSQNEGVCFGTSWAVPALMSVLLWWKWRISMQIATFSNPFLAGAAAAISPSRDGMTRKVLFCSNWMQFRIAKKIAGVSLSVWPSTWMGLTSWPGKYYQYWGLIPN